jgi:hypothetical protein
MKTRNLYNLIVLLISFLLSENLFAQVGINATGASPDPKAMLDINSTSKGFLWPRMTLAQRSAISTAPGVTPEGLTIFDTDTKNLWMWKNSTWVPYLQSTWETLGNDIFNNNSGNVAIGGAVSPTSKLKVYGQVNFSNPANIRSMVYDPASVNNVFFSGGDAEIKTLAPNSNLNLQRFVDLKLAVGDIIPTQKVDIDGQIRIRGGSPALGKVLTSAADGTASWQSLAGSHNHYGESWTGSALNGFTVTNFASADFNVAISGNANTALRSKGIVGSSTSTTGIGVYGINSSGGGSLFSPADNSGVSGVAGNGIGVFGAGYSGSGIWGISNSAVGVYGNSVLGNSIYGAKTSGQTTGSAGVFEVLNVANTSSALVARSENTALEIDGAIKVINTSVNKPVFTHVTSGANISLHLTSITYNNPLVTDLLIVTPNYTAGSVYNAHPIGVWFNGGVWKIFNQDLAAMPIGTAFNVMVIRQ